MPAMLMIVDPRRLSAAPPPLGFRIYESYSWVFYCAYEDDALSHVDATRPISNLRKQRASDWRQIWVLKEPDCALKAAFVTGARCPEIGADLR